MTLPKGAEGRQSRVATFDRATVDAEARTAELAFSSEQPVDRWWGVEILGHSAGEIDDEFVASGCAPLLMDHNARDQVGVVEGVTLGADRKMRAVVRFSRSARGEEIMQDVKDGIRSNVSVGYELRDLTLVKEEKGKPPVYRATKWRPFEVSLVSIPADTSVGVGREADPPPPSIPAQPKTPETRMSDIPTTDPAAAEAAEQKRQKEILALAELANCRDRGVDAILKGTSLEAFRGEVLLARQGEKRPLGAPPTELGLSPKETQRYSLMRAMRAVSDNDWSEAGLELEASKEIEKRLGGNARKGKRSFFVPLEVQERPVNTGRRDAQATTLALGGALVATSNQSFIEILRNRAIVMTMGATRLTGLMGNVTVPRQTGAATAAWLGTEATPAGESDLAFGQMTLTPRNVAAYTEVSRQLMMQSDPSIESIITTDLAAVVGLAVDSAAMNGTGAAGQPLGLLRTSGIGSVSGTSLGYAGVIEFQTDVLSANALVNPGAAGYVTTPAVAGLLVQRQRFTSTDSPLWQGNLLDGQVAGFPARSSVNVPAANMVFGDWSQLVVAEWGALEIDVNPFANFPAGISGIRAFYTVDVGVRYALAFSAASSIT